jgi:hypothetical protein
VSITCYMQGMIRQGDASQQQKNNNPFLPPPRPNNNKTRLQKPHALEARAAKGVEDVDEGGNLRHMWEELERGVPRAGPEALSRVVPELGDACFLCVFFLSKNGGVGGKKKIGRTFFFVSYCPSNFPSYQHRHAARTVEHQTQRGGVAAFGQDGICLGHQRPKTCICSNLCGPDGGLGEAGGLGCDVHNERRGLPCCGHRVLAACVGLGRGFCLCCISGHPSIHPFIHPTHAPIEESGEVEKIHLVGHGVGIGQERPRLRATGQQFSVDFQMPGGGSGRARAALLRMRMRMRTRLRVLAVGDSR